MARPVTEVRLSKSLLERVSKDEFCVLAYFQTSQERTIPAMQKWLGLGSDRIIRTLSSLKRKGLASGQSTRPETIQLTADTLIKPGDAVCRLPTRVLFFAPRARQSWAKQLLCYYFREGGDFEGTLAELASGIGMRHRNANYCLLFMERHKIVKRENRGHGIKLELIEDADRPLLMRLGLR
jgi:hypothetical protein